MTRAFLLFPLLFAASLATPVRAQSESDFWAYVALTLTPTGAFAPLSTAVRVATPASAAVSLRYGHLSVGNAALHNIGVTADFRSGRGRLGITAGTRTCDGCGVAIMLGADWTTRLVDGAMSEGGFGVELTTAVGAGIPTSTGAEGVVLSGSLGLPLSLVAGRADGVRVVPFVTPAVGVGTFTGDGGETGVRPMIGGGLGLLGGNGLGLTAGFQKVLVDGGKTVLGLAITIGGVRR